MLLERFVNGRARSNAYVYARDDRRALIVDAGVGAAAKVIDLVGAEGLEPDALILTHGHPDHIWTARELSDRFEIPVFINADDDVWFVDPATGGSMPVVRVAGRLYGRSRRLRPSRLRKFAEDTVTGGSFGLTALHTPGHTRGSTCFVVDDLCFSGDTVFRQGLGNTSYPGGSRSALRESIRSKLLALPDSLRVLPGHGGDTTVGAERSLWERFAAG